MPAADDKAQVGDQYTFVAIDNDTKLVPCWLLGKRTADTTWAFIADLEQRLHNRVQIASDGFEPYVQAIDSAFRGQVDYVQVLKSYSETPAGRGRYSPPAVVGIEKKTIIGTPDLASITTSYVERQNLSIRMECRRLTRLTNAFSKKVENLKATLDLHFANYNFIRFHRSLRCRNGVR